jgi:NAD(P)H-nitrite reductase large subunit
VVKSPQILSQMVDIEAAKIITSCLEKNGIKIITNVAAQQIKGGECVEGILLDNGEEIKCQLIIIGKGVRPNTELAQICGIKIGDGILVDKYLCTSNENVFAAGDVAETIDITKGVKRINALWPCAIEQGEIAGLNMLGKKTIYEGSLSMNSVDFFDLPCISMGITKPQKNDGCEIVSNIRGEIYKKLVFKENKIVGMIFVGDISTAGIISTLIKNKVDISSIKHLLLEDDFNYAKIMPLIANYKESFKQEEFQDTIITYK